MPEVLINVVVGLTTTVLSGSSVWIWQKIRGIRTFNRKAAFFGLRQGGTCLLVMNHTHDAPGRTHTQDVHAIIEIARLVSEIGSDISVRYCDDFHESNANRTEFCIGGLNSNDRTVGHLVNYLPGVTLRPFRAGRPDSAAIVVNGQRFAHRHGVLEHALVAKFTPPGASRPVFIICGQRAIDNRAAAHFLAHSLPDPSKDSRLHRPVLRNTEDHLVRYVRLRSRRNRAGRHFCGIRSVERTLTCGQ